MPQFNIGQKLKAKYDIGDNPARGKKGHIYCLKGETVVIRQILEENLTHPLRVSRPKNTELIFGVNPCEVETIEQAKKLKK